MAALPGQLPGPSDQITLDEITDASNTTNVTSNMSLTTAYTNLGYNDNPPPSSQFGFDRWRGANTGFYRNDGVNDYIQGSWGRSYDMRSNDWSIVCWVRVNQSTKSNAVFWSFNEATPSNTDRIYLQYNASFNRLIINLRTNSQNFLRAIALHDNSSVSGITNSGTGWTTGQRGNVNGQNWTMLTITYDASASTPAAAFGVYWNATAFTGTTSQPNQGRSNFNPAIMTLMDLSYNTPTSNNADFDIDEWKYFEGVLPSSTVTNLYNSGVIRNNSNLSTITLTQTQVSFDSFDDRAEDTAGYWSPTITGGSRNLHSDGTALN